MKATRPDPRRVLLAAVVLGTAAWLTAACTSAPTTPAATPATTTPRIKNAQDAGQQLGELEQRGDCLELQSAYLEMRTKPIALAADPSQDKLDEFREEVERLRGKIPEAARADYDVVARAYEGLLTTFDGVDLKDPAKVQQNAPRARDALRALDDPAVKTATQRLDAFFTTCAGQR